MYSYKKIADNDKNMAIYVIGLSPEYDVKIKNHISIGYT
jgi:hypothetical protein